MLENDSIELRIAALESQAAESIKLLESLAIALSAVTTVDQALLISELFRLGVMGLKDGWRGRSDEGEDSKKKRTPAPYEKGVW